MHTEVLHEIANEVKQQSSIMGVMVHPDFEEGLELAEVSSCNGYRSNCTWFEYASE